MVFARPSTHSLLWEALIDVFKWELGIAYFAPNFFPHDRKRYAVCINALHYRTLIGSTDRLLRTCSSRVYVCFSNHEMLAVTLHGAAFYVRQLVIIAMFLSAEGQKTGEFEALKSQDGTALCAMSTPDNKISVRSKLHCYSKCVSDGCVCASGDNYRKNEKLCEMYSAQPVDYHVVPDCTFYQVGLLSGWT